MNSSNNSETPLFWLAIRGAAAVPCPMPQTREQIERTDIHVGGSPDEQTFWMLGGNNSVMPSNYESLVGFSTAEDRQASFEILIHGTPEEMVQEVHHLEERFERGEVVLVQPVAH